VIINIVTPCSRPENLMAMSESINIPLGRYRWIVVIDATDMPSVMLPKNAEVYLAKVDGSTSGNGQRNKALDMIDAGYVLFLDDDTILHKDLWDAVRYATEDVVCWQQSWKDGSHRLDAGDFRVGHIDSGSFMANRSVIGDIRWDLDRYDADGYFAEKVFAEKRTIRKINQYLSHYNDLR